MRRSFGSVLETIRRPPGDNPKSIDEMARLIAASPARDGARYQRQVAELRRRLKR